MRNVTLQPKTEAVSCTCLAHPCYSADGEPAIAGLIEINDCLYTILPLGSQSDEGFRLTNLRNGQVYDLDTSSGQPLCDCIRAMEVGNCAHDAALRRLRNEGTI